MKTRDAIAEHEIELHLASVLSKKALLIAYDTLSLKVNNVCFLFTTD